MGAPRARRPHRVGRGARRSADHRAMGWTSARRWSPRAWSTPTPIPYSSATDPTRPPRDWRASPMPAGGILRTVAATRAATDDELRGADRRAVRGVAGGRHDHARGEVRLRALDRTRSCAPCGSWARRRPRSGIRVVRTFLGAHAVPPEADSMDEYVETVINEMLPAVASEACRVLRRLLRRRLLLDGRRPSGSCTPPRATAWGIRLHADQLTRTGRHGAGGSGSARRRVDHLEQLDAAGVAALAASRHGGDPAPRPRARPARPACRRRARSSTPVRPWPSPATPTPAPTPTGSRCRSSSGSGRRCSGMTVGRGGRGGHRGRGRRPRSVSGARPGPGGHGRRPGGVGRGARRGICPSTLEASDRSESGSGARSAPA